MKKENSVYLIGIAGGTGSGKTTVASKIREILKESITVISQDSYYRDMDRVPVEERNYDHPDAFDTELLADQLKDLKAKRPIECPVYDFATHKRHAETKRIEGTHIIILEGILIFYFKKLRELMDFKIFVDTPSDVRLTRRILRDMNERGRTLDSVIDQYLGTVRPMHIEFVEPTKKFADIIVPEGGYNEKAVDLMSTYLKSYLRGQPSQ